MTHEPYPVGMAEPEGDLPAILDLINRGPLDFRGVHNFGRGFREQILGEYLAEDPEKAQQWDIYFSNQDLKEWLLKDEPEVYDVNNGLRAALILHGYQDHGLKELNDLNLFARVEVAKQQVAGSNRPEVVYGSVLSRIRTIGSEYGIGDQIDLYASSAQFYENLFQAEAKLARSSVNTDQSLITDAYIAMSLFSTEVMRFRDAICIAPDVYDLHNEAIVYLVQNGLYDQDAQAATADFWAMLARQYKHSDPAIRETALLSLASLRTLYPNDKEYRRLARRVRSAHGITSLLAAESKSGIPLSPEEDELVQVITNDLILPTVTRSSIDLAVWHTTDQMLDAANRSPAGK